MRIALAVLATLAWASSAALGQEYPARPVRLVVPYAAGGGVDIVARTVAPKLSELLGAPIVVENRTGGATNIASDLVAKSSPDGYTLLMASPSNAVNMSLLPDVPYDVQRDLAPVSLIGAVPNVLAARRSLPANNVRELIALAKAQPGKLTYGSGGNGSTQHLAGELFKRYADIDILHVPYKGGAPAAVDVMGGQIDMLFGNVLETLQYIRAGRLKAIATTGPRRASSLPDVPTIGETLPGYEVSVWWGIMAPAGTPRPIVDKLSREIARTLEAPEVRERLTAMGADIRGSTSEEFGAFVKNEVAKWARVIKDAHIRPD